MKIIIARVFIALLILAGIGSGVRWWKNHQDAQTKDTLTLHGNVDIREVQLAFNGKDRITEMLVEEGDRVSKGQLLATLDSRRLTQAVEAAEARVASQAAVVSRMVAGTRSEDIRKARSEMDAAKVEFQDLENYARRIEVLAAKELVTNQERDDARARADAARARWKAASETFELAIAGPRKEDIASAKATLNTDKAELALAQRELIDASLYAPSDGIIEDRLLEPGDMASPERPVFTLALSAPLWVRGYISEPDLGKIHLGMNASVQTDSFPDKLYEGWIGFISPKAEFTPKSVETREVRTSLVYQVRVFICNPQDELRLGMPATVTVPLDQQTQSPSGDTQDYCRSSG